MRKINRIIASTAMLGLTLSPLALNTNLSTVKADDKPVKLVKVVSKGNIKARESASFNAPVSKSDVKPDSEWVVNKVEKDANGVTWYNLGETTWVNAATVKEVAAQPKKETPKAVPAAAPSIPAPTFTNNPVTPVTYAQPVQQNIQVPKANSDAAQKVINIAMAQLGKPYVWGGKGPSVFDCSGLMYYAFMNGVGINIGGYTIPQENSGTVIGLNELQPGDLIFWGSRGATYHVALALGNNQYVHAPAPGQGVKVQTISSYFMPSFGVRVL